jgi:hypothetical protein
LAGRSLAVGWEVAGGGVAAPGGARGGAGRRGRPGKVSNRVWLTSGERGLIGQPVSLPVLREGVQALAKLVRASGVAGPPIIGVEATGRLHWSWPAFVDRLAMRRVLVVGAAARSRWV